MNEELEWYPWYWRAFEGSRRVRKLTYVERGLYRTILDECWRVGAVPDDVDKLTEICDCPVGVMAEAWPKIKRLMIPKDGLDGIYLTSERLERERAQAVALREKKSRGGKRGAETRKKLQQQLNALKETVKSLQDSRIPTVPDRTVPDITHLEENAANAPPALSASKAQRGGIPEQAAGEVNRFMDRFGGRS